MIIETPILKSKSLTLRNLEMNDIKDYYEFASDPDVTQYLCWGPHESLSVTENYFLEIQKDGEKDNNILWGIEEKKSHKLIGVVHLYSMDYTSKKAQIGYLLSKKYWDKGYVKEALDAVLNFCFIELHLNRIEGLSIKENTWFINTLKSQKMRYEGTLREYAYQKKKFHDFEIYSILESEYLIKD